MSPVPTAPQVLVRAAGVAVAATLPSRRWAATVLAGTYAAGWAIDRRGIQVIALTGPEVESPLVRDAIPLATSAASWTAVNLAALAGVRRLPLPRPVAAAAYAALVAVVETQVIAGLDAAQGDAVRDAVTTASTASADAST